MAINGYELTDEKVLKLKPIIESILSRKYGKQITFKNLTVGNITVEESQKGE
ncbi:hypothetical protein ACFCYN_20495 [Gottfriedia sp. NPDC056225]|uniref:hypothetical protein n=1 Tax=Gottfriedia sp. NPDC056225 TaxID=3345751 RepID=UPI0035D6BD72